MKDFVYCAPTKVVFGRGVEAQAGALLKEAGAKCALVHYGKASAAKSGLLSRVISSLESSGIAHVELGGVAANPRLSLVREGIALCRDRDVDFLLAVGGGSVIDSAKAIGYGAVFEGDVWDLYLKKVTPRASLPLMAVPTIAAAGSEMSDSSVITNEEGLLKRGLSSPWGRARFALVNPELTFTLSEWQSMCGCVDIMMHTMERWFSPEEDSDLTDSLASALLKAVMRAATVVLQNPTDYNARSELSWAASLSHNGLTGCGRSGDWACHQLEHEISGMFDVAHGAGLSAIWASWARHVMPAAPSRFAKFACEVMAVPFDAANPMRVAREGIERTEAFFRSLNMPTRISELGVKLDDEAIKTLAFKCSFEGTRTIGGIKCLDQADMEAIYRAAR